MSKIEFSNQQKEVIVTKIQRYFEQELDQDIGQFDAEFLLDFFSDQVGAYYYNQGLQDAQAVIQGSLLNISEAIDGIEKQTD
ncbi:MAG: DUF2164 domain-containing protein [Gammaproteobacteria bacterium]|jgi:uncharacterized protein (DUF2164 family)|nr:DUF2164 domain-containing protein [Gammaproteobacteria bacterium]MBT3724445.1 DUF2164 domain-containing protein [Gammaproteobacteria bacterium]MBT4076406.1 DUF2164 domain-containing protein [Gammaproteobacteria bacterium]MBT4195615.1 DUF2164 domain-containing protein [Gammaproteobacteria bacterium]MBT4450552.1 DUF2164 domain-containing protein [Gammaproteobacteria bacterium]